MKKIVLFTLQERLKYVPWPLLTTVYALVGLGLLNLYSATGAMLVPGRFNDQVNWVILGTCAMILWGLVFDTKTIERLSVIVFLSVCGLLAAVDIFGKSAKGAERWLALGPVRLQPSEFAKFMIILIMAKSFTMVKDTYEFTLPKLWRQMLFIVIPFVLIYLQPDLGTAGIVLLIGAFQIAFVRIDFKSLMAVVVSALVSVWTAWHFYLYDYQKQRILNFLNPMRDPKGSGYHSLQSMIAVGSGGVWGRGFQQGTQAQLNFLPERHTDFIFSVWAEEHGFMGCLLLFGLYVTLIFQVFQIAEGAKDLFSTLIALGVAAFLMFHFLINVSMVLGIFPVVGVPLSLISYGGSHMLTVFSCIGLLVAVERRKVLYV